MNLNKGISTPIAIGLIVVVSAVVGVLVWQFAKTSEQPTPKQAGDYITQSACKEADYYWYNDSCHEEKQKIETELPVPQVPSLTFLEGAKPSVQITWNRQIADYFNVYRATSPEGPWTKIIEKHPKNAGSAVDYDYPKDTEVLYYKVTSVNEDGVESEPSEVSSVKLTENKTADWKTYENEEYGFKIKYLSKIEEDKIGYKENVEPGFEEEPVRLFQLKIPYVFDDSPFQSEPFDLNLDSDTHPICYARFFVKAVPASEYSSLTELKEEYSKSEFITVDGVKALRRNEFIGLLPGGGGKEDVVYISKDSRLFMIEYIIDRESLGNEENKAQCLTEQEEVFNQMLSTFEFTE